MVRPPASGREPYMREHEIRGLLHDVRAGRQSRREFVQTMVAFGLAVPLASGWRNEEYDRLYKAAETEMYPVKRAALFIRMNDLVVQSGIVVPIVLRTKAAAMAGAAARHRAQRLRGRLPEPRLLVPGGVAARVPDQLDFAIWPGTSSPVCGRPGSARGGGRDSGGDCRRRSARSLRACSAPRYAA